MNINRTEIQLNPNNTLRFSPFQRLKNGVRHLTLTLENEIELFKADFSKRTSVKYLLEPIQIAVQKLFKQTVLPPPVPAPLPVPISLQEPELPKLPRIQNEEAEKLAIQEKSLLRNIPNAPPARKIDPELIRIFSEAGGDFDLARLLEYFEKHPSFTQHQTLLAALKAANQKEQRFASIIAIGQKAGTDTEQADGQLLQLAKDFALEISTLSPGQSQYLPFVLGKEALVGQHTFDKFINTAKTTFEQVKGQFAPTSEIEQQILDSVKAKKDAISSFARRFLPESICTAVEKSLLEDCKDIFMDSMSGIQGHEFAEKLWDSLSKNGVHGSIEKTITDALNNHMETIQSYGKDVLQELSAHVPLEAQTVLSETADYHLQHSHGWLQVEKQANNTFKVTVYAKASRLDLPGTTPLVIENIPQETIDSNLIYRLLSFTAWPAWKKTKSFTYNDFCTGFLNVLGTPSHPKDEDANMRNFLGRASSNKTSQLLSIIASKISADPALCLFTLKKQLLFDGWATAKHHPADLHATSLLPLARSLYADAKNLRSQNLITANDCDKILATYLDLAMISPPEKIGFLDALKPGSSITSTFGVIKEVVKDVLGDEAEKMADTLIESVTPDTPSNTPSLAATISGSDWKDITGVTQVNKCVGLIKKFRLSLYHSVRLLGSVLNVLNHPFIGSLLGFAVHIGLVLTVPGYALLSPSFCLLVSKTVIQHGINALYWLLPGSMVQYLQAASNFIQEVKDYFYKRIKLAALKTFIYFVVDPKILQSLTLKAKSLQQSLIKVGQISYDIPDHKIDRAKLSPTPVVLKPSFYLACNKKPTTSQIHPVPFTPDVLDSWLIPFKDFSSLNVCYLIEKISSLPIPVRGQANPIWDDVSDIHKTIISLDNLAKALLINHERDAHKQNGEIICIHALYAIVDYLARKDPASHMADLPATRVPELMRWTSEITSQVPNQALYNQLQDIAAYFAFDANKRYTDDELNTISRTTLFHQKTSKNESYKDLLFFSYLAESTCNCHIRLCHSTHSCAYAYYKTLANDPQIQQKMTTPVDGADFDKIIELYSDPQTPSHPDGILPQSFRTLRLIDTLAHNVFYIQYRESTRSNPPSLHFKMVSKNTFMSPLITAEAELHVDFPGMVKVKPVETAPVSFSHNITTQRSQRDITKLRGAKFLLQPGQESEHSSIINILQEVQTKDKQFFTLFFSTQEKINLELATSNKSDMFVRTLAFFKNYPEKLLDDNCKKLFSTFLLNTGALQLQLKEHPAFGAHINDYFMSCLDNPTLNQNENAFQYLIELACSLEALQPGLLPQLKPRIRQLLNSHQNNARSCMLLNALHSTLRFVDIEHLPREERNQALKDISRQLFSPLYTPFSYTLFQRWKTLLFETTESDESFKNELLTYILKRPLKPNEENVDVISLLINPTQHNDAHDEIVKATAGYVQARTIKLDLKDTVQYDNTGVTVDRKTGHIFLERDSKKYTLVKDASFTDTGFAHWLELGTTDNRRVFVTKGSAIIKEILIDKRDEVQVSLDITNHGLSLLSWICPLSKIEAFCNTDTPEKISRIVLPNVNLQFKSQVINGIEEMVSVETFNNFYIKREQKLPALDSTPQYLILENHKKEQLVLIPKQTEITSAITHCSNTLLETALPHFITKLTDQGVKNNAKSSYYVYSVNKSGELDSNDAAAIANRVLHYVSTNTPTDCKKWLQKLEDAGRIHPFTDDVYEQIHLMMIPLLSVSHAQWLGVGLKLAAISRNNALLHNHSRKDPFSIKFLDQINGKHNELSNSLIFWTLLQLGYTHYLGLLKNGAKNTLTAHEELLLLHEIGRISAELVSSKLPKDDTYLDSIFEPQVMLEQLAMSPEIVHRYQKIKHDLQEPVSTREAFNYFLYLAINEPPVPIEDTSTGVLAQTSNTLDKVQNGLDKATGLVAHYLRFKAQNPVTILDKDFLAKVARVGYTKLSQKQQFKIAQFFHINIQQMLVKPYPCLKEVTLSLNPEIHASFATDFVNYAPAYFCLATRRPPKNLTAEETDQFFQKSDRFRKNLTLLVGSYKDLETELIVFYKALSQGKAISDTLYSSIEKYWYNNDSSIDEILKKTSPLTPEEKLIYQNAKSVAYEITLFAHQNANAYKIEHIPPEIRSHFVQKFEYWKSKGASKMAQDLLYYGTYLYNPLSIIGYTKWAYNLLWAARTVVNTSHKVSLLQKSAAATIADSRKSDVPEKIKISSKAREQHLDRLLLQVLDEFFDVTTVLVPPCTQDVRSYPIKSDTLALDAAYKSLNQSIHDFANREVEVVTTTSLKHSKNPEDLLKKIDLLTLEITSYEIKAKRDIEEFVNDRANKHKKRHELKTVYTFNDIENAFIRGLETTLADLTHDELIALQEKLYLYQITHSRMASLMDCRDIHKIGSLLARKRTYGLDSNQPEKWLRAKLSFESRTGHFLWKKPMEQLQKMLFGNHRNQVLELIMASGKTFYGIPTTDFMLADGDTLLINIWPPGLAPINTQNIGLQSRLVFDAPATAAKIVRQDGWDVESVMALYRNLKAMRHNSGHYNMTQSDAQAAELKFLELCLLNKKGKQNVKALTYLKECIKLIRTSGIALPDEAHDVFKSRKELNYPFGKAKILSQNLLSIMNEVLFHLANCPQLSLKTGTWHKLPEAYFHNTIKPILADAIIASSLLELSAAEKAVCREYITSKLDYIPDFVLNGPHKREIALVKGMFEELLPHILGRIIDVDFCKSENTLEEFAKPSDANMSPMQRSVIQNPFEAYTKTCMIALRQRIEPTKMLQYLLTLQASAQAESAKSAIRINNTKSGKIFASFGLDMQLENLKVDAVEQMVASDKCTLEYVKSQINPQIRYFPKKLSSNAQNFASMFSSFYADTGTPYNHGSFPEGTHVVWDKGTLGETIELLQRKCASDDSVQVLKAEAPLEVLQEMLQEHFGAHGRAICDRGALFRGVDNLSIAKNIMQFITNNRPDLQGVVFYLKNQEYVLEKGSDTPIKLEDCTLAKEQLITYFDQYHTFGANVPQANNAECLVTVGEDIMLAHFCQAVWRMRGLKTAHQTLKIITTKKVVEAMNANGKKPTIDDIITFALENEAGILADDNFHADKQKLHDFVRRRILDKILAADSIEESIALVKEFETFFCTMLDDDPFALYGKIKTQIDPLTALEEYKKELLTAIDSKPSITDEDKEALEDQFEQFDTGVYPEKVSTTDSGLGLALELDNDQNEQQIEEMEQQQNLQQDLQQDQIVHEQVDSITEPVFWSWSKMIDPTNLAEWLECDHQEPPIFGIQKVLKEAESETLKELAHFFSPEIISTNNFTPMINTNLLPVYIAPFGIHQKPILEVLIITKDQKRRILLVDQKEAKYWRKMLAKERQKNEVYDPAVQLSLYDITLGAVVASGKIGHNEQLLHNDPIFQRSIAMLKFLNGDLHYNDKQAKALANWIQKCGPEKMQTAFLELYHDHQIGNFHGSTIETLLSKKQPSPTSV